MTKLIASKIKDAVTMEDVLKMYGNETSSNGRIPCPLHNGHDKNFSYKEKFFKCFVCGESGSVIDFVMKLFGIPFRQAVLRINADFSLALTGAEPNPAVRAALLERKRRREKKKEELRRLESRHRELCKELRYWIDVHNCFEPTETEWTAGDIYQLYLDSVNKIPYIEYLLDDLEETMWSIKKAEVF